LNLLKIEVGILILKPELPGDRQTVFKSTLLSLVSEIGSHVIAEMKIKLTPEKARKLWGKDIGHHSWAENFYNHLSQKELILFIIEGSTSAKNVKSRLRSIFQELINDLNYEHNMGFSLDLIHGSDEGEGLKELGIISEGEEVI